MSSPARAAARILAQASLALAALGCQVESLFPTMVGDGAARLTVKNAGALLSVINADRTCGFAAPSVITDFVVEGEVGQTGTVTWTVADCDLDFGPEPVSVGADCTGAETTVTGRAVVDATRTIRGLITGNPETPVVPESPDAVSLSLHAVVFGYRVQMGTEGPSALMKQAVLDVAADVHLAQSESLGVCAIPTNAVTLRSIVVTEAAYEIDDGEGRVFDVPVTRAEINAQVGRYQERENEIGGSIRVWDSNVDLAHDPHLDPNYDADAFVDTFACAEDLKLPIAYTCESLAPRLAEGAAKLSIQTVGNLVSAFSKDTTCGFKSAAVQAAPELTGEVGRDGGTALFRIDQACDLDFGPEGRTLPADCSGYSPVVFGRVRFTGNMEIRGRRTGNPEQPIIPTSRDAVTLRFRMELDNAKVQGQSPEVMEVAHGAVTGTMRPRLAIDTTNGACSIDTPVVSFEGIAWEPGSEAVIRTGGNALDIRIDESLLDAQNGKKGERENYLEGRITVGGEPYTIPLEGGEPVLDPSYDADAFNDAWTCEPNLRVPASDRDCSMKQVIADGVARLVIQTTGTVASAVNADDQCGYSNKMDVLKNPTRVDGRAGEMGALTWAIQNCGLGPGGTTEAYATDCIGAVTHWSGNANVDSTRTVRGLREDVEVFLLGRVADSVAPMDPHSVDLWLTDVALDEFASWALAPGQQEPLGILTIHQGTLNAFVKPMTGWDEGQQRYTIPTPVASLQGVRLQNAHATLVAQGMTFVVDIADTNLWAVNGRIGEDENSISGTVTVDGEVINIGGSLNPDYDEAELAASWACNVAPEMGACDQVGHSDLGLGGLLLLSAWGRLCHRRRR